MTADQEEQQRPPLPPVPTLPIGLEDMVNRLEDLVNFTLECEKKPLKEGISFVEVFSQLSQIRTAVTALSQEQQKLLAVLSATAQAIPGGLGPSLLTPPPEAAKVFETIKHLQEVCESAKDRIHSELSGRPEVAEEVMKKAKETEESVKKKKIRRKSKFKAIGGKEGWIPT